MEIALILLSIQGVIGAFDTLYYHEWKAHLPARGRTSAPELYLHAARDFLYAVLFGTLPWLAWHGAWVAGLGAQLRRWSSLSLSFSWRCRCVWL